MRCLLAGLLLLLGGCNSDPMDGDIYENNLTQERVQIDVGDCSFLESMQDDENDRIKRVNKEIGKSNRVSMKNGEYKPINYDYKRSSRKCVGYEQKGSLTRVGEVTEYVISDIDKFKENFTRIN